MPTIAILGAKGRLGHACALAFHQAGFKVLALSRTGKVPTLPNDIEQRAVNALDQAALIQATQGADFIFNGLNPPYAQWQTEVLTLGRNVIAAAKAHQAIQLFPGNIYNYGSTVPAIITPTTSFQADTSLGKIRVELEQLLQQTAEQQGVKTLILRAGDFYGAGKDTWFDVAIFKDIAKGKLTYPNQDWNIPHEWVYLPDLAQAFVALAQRANELPSFGQWLFAGHTLTGEQLHTLTEQLVSKPLKRVEVPWGLLKVLGVLNRNLRLMQEVRYLWQRPHQLVDERVTEWKLVKTPIEQALSQTLKLIVK